jgi:predicted DNA-binding protein YlxM (UPF0122 family)
MDLFGLKGFLKRDRFRTRKQAIQNCLDRTDDPDKRARYEHALVRVQSEQTMSNIKDALTSGWIDDRRSNYN